MIDLALGPLFASHRELRAVVEAVLERRQGRATRDVGLVPAWSASNPVSQRLAVRLGYEPAGVCEVLYLHAGGV